jgi:hypothetical protein
MKALTDHGKLIVDLPHADDDGKWIAGVQLYFEDGTPLEDVANFIPDDESGGIWVLLTPAGSSSDWKLFPHYEVPWGQMRTDHNYPEDYEEEPA